MLDAIYSPRPANSLLELTDLVPALASAGRTWASCLGGQDAQQQWASIFAIKAVSQRSGVGDPESHPARYRAPGAAGKHGLAAIPLCTTLPAALPAQTPTRTSAHSWYL